MTPQEQAANIAAEHATARDFNHYVDGCRCGFRFCTEEEWGAHLAQMLADGGALRPALSYRILDDDEGVPYIKVEEAPDAG